MCSLALKIVQILAYITRFFVHNRMTLWVGVESPKEFWFLPIYIVYLFYVLRVCTFLFRFCVFSYFSLNILIEFFFIYFKVEHFIFLLQIKRDTNDSINSFSHKLSQYIDWGVYRLFDSSNGGWVVLRMFLLLSIHECVCRCV